VKFSSTIGLSKQNKNKHLHFFKKILYNNYQIMDNIELAQPNKNKYFLILVVILSIITIALIAAIFYVKFYSPQKNNLSNTTLYLDSQKQDLEATKPTPSYPPKKLIPNIGTAGTFNISQSQKSGPIFVKASIDPLSPETAKKISATLTLKSKQPITDFSGKIKTDQGYLPIELSRVSRTEDVETWIGKYHLTQPVLYTYILEFTVNDETGTKTDYSLALRTDS